MTPPTHLWKIKKVKLVGEIYSESRRELIAEVLRAEAGDPIAACKRHDSLELVTYPGKMRKGHPRDNWWVEGLKEYWEHITNNKFT